MGLASAFQYRWTRSSVAGFAEMLRQVSRPVPRMMRLTGSRVADSV